MCGFPRCVGTCTTEELGWSWFSFHQWVSRLAGKRFTRPHHLTATGTPGFPKAPSLLKATLPVAQMQLMEMIMQISAPSTIFASWSEGAPPPQVWHPQPEPRSNPQQVFPVVDGGGELSGQTASHPSDSPLLSNPNSPGSHF